MRKIISGFIAVLFFSAVQAREAPVLAAKGIESYRKGRYVQARHFFAQAMQQAVLQAREDWITKAALNLIDMELDAYHFREAGELLEKIPGISDPELQTAVLWKKAQYYFYTGRIDSASDVINQTVSRCKDQYSFCNSVRIDAYRIQIESELLKSGELENLKTQVKGFKDKLPKDEKGSIEGLEALIAMKKGDYTGAARLWQNAADYHRAVGQIPKMAKCLNYLALSQLINGRERSARETNSRSVDVYKSTGLTLPGLRAYALNLFIITDSKELDKIKKNLELISESQPDFNLKAVLQDYKKFANLSLPPSLSYLLP